MTRAEFVTALAYVTAGCGKQLPDASLEVYWDCLGDLPVDAFRAAAKSVMMKHVWSTFPSIAELREAAFNSMQGNSATMPAQEAFAIAWRAAGKIDPDITGEFRVHHGVGTEPTTYASITEYALADVPEHVKKAMHTFGISRLVSGKEPLGVLQAQFCQTYTALQLTAKRDAMLPQSLRDELARIGRTHEAEKDQARPAPGPADERMLAARG